MAMAIQKSGLTESGGQGVQGRDLAAESMYEYGSRVGFWRIIRLFQARHLPLTILAVRWRSSVILRPPRLLPRPAMTSAAMAGAGEAL